MTATLDQIETETAWYGLRRHVAALGAVVTLAALALGLGQVRSLAALDHLEPLRLNQESVLTVPPRGALHAQLCGAREAPEGARLVVSDSQSQGQIVSLPLETGKALSARCSLAVWRADRAGPVRVRVTGSGAGGSLELRVTGALDAGRALPVLLLFLGLLMVAAGGPRVRGRTDAPRAAAWHAAMLFVALLVLLASNVTGALVVALGGLSAPTMMAAMVAQHLALALLSAGVLCRVAEGPVLARLGLGRLGGPRLGAAVLSGGALLGVAGLVTHLMGDVGDSPMARQLSTVPMRYAMAATALLAPLSEELFFRGLLFRALKRGGALGAARWQAAALSGLVFAATHAMQLQGAWLGLVPILAVGLVNGYWREVSGGLTAPWVVHTVYNGAIIVGLFASS